MYQERSRLYVPMASETLDLSHKKLSAIIMSDEVPHGSFGVTVS